MNYNLVNESLNSNHWLF